METADSRLSLAAALGVLLLGALAGAFLYGFEFGISNNEFHAIIVSRLASGHPWQGDLLSGTIGGFASPFWWGVGVLAQWVSTPTLFWLLYVGARWLLGVGLWSVLRVFAERGRLELAVIAAILALSPAMMQPLPLGHDPVLAPFLSQTYVSIGLCLASVAAYLRSRFVPAGVLLGLAYDVNLMQANFVTGVVAAVTLVNLALTPRAEWRMAVRRYAVAGLTMVAVALPLAWLMLQPKGAPLGIPFDGRSLADFAAFHFSGHHFWALKSAFHQREGLALVASMVAAGGAFAIQRRAGWRDPLVRAWWVSSAVFVGYVVVEILAEQLWPSRIQLAAHLFRSDALGYPLTAVLLVALVTRGIELEPRPILTALLCASLVAWLHHAFTPAALLLFATWLVPVLERVRVARWGIAAGLVALALAVAVARGPLTPLSLAAGLGAVVAVAWTRQDRAAPIATLVASVAVLAATLDVGRVRSTVERADLLPDELASLAAVARERVSRDAVFLVPPYVPLRSHLDRSVYFGMKDGAAYLWAPGFEQEYLRRLRLLGLTYTPGRQYLADVIVREFSRNLPCTIVRATREGVTHTLLPIELTPGVLPEACLVRSPHYCVAPIGIVERALASRADPCAPPTH